MKSDGNYEQASILKASEIKEEISVFSQVLCFSSQPIGAVVVKYLWPLQSHLAQGRMEIVHIHIEDKWQMLARVGRFFCLVWKEYSTRETLDTWPRNRSDQFRPQMQKSHHFILYFIKVDCHQQQIVKFRSCDINLRQDCQLFNNAP